jgi:hypothetical protein
MVRSVPSGSRAEADALARAGQALRIDESIQLGHLRGAQHVVNHEIALKIEQVLLQLALRAVHGHSLLGLRSITRPAVPSLASDVGPSGPELR